MSTTPATAAGSKRPLSDSAATNTENGDHRKRRRNRTTQSCMNCHTSKRMVHLPTWFPRALSLNPRLYSVTGNVPAGVALNWVWSVMFLHGAPCRGIDLGIYRPLSASIKLTRPTQTLKMKLLVSKTASLSSRPSLKR